MNMELDRKNISDKLGKFTAASFLDSIAMPQTNLV